MSLPLLLCSSLFLAACATPLSNGRAQDMVPASFSAAYSELGMRLQLATAAKGDPCADFGCGYALAFDMQVLRLGSRLSKVAYDVYPDLRTRVEKFEIVVADKFDPGATSSANGKVVIYRGLSKLRLDEVSLAFVIAREMAQVIATHHDENSAVSILFSVLSQVLLPVANLARSAAAIIQANTLTAATATTAASFAGSKLVKSNKQDEQSEEADAVALSLLDKLGWSPREVSDALTKAVRTPGGDAWLKDLYASVVRCGILAERLQVVAHGTSP